MQNIRGFTSLFLVLEFGNSTRLKVRRKSNKMRHNVMILVAMVMLLICGIQCRTVSTTPQQEVSTQQIGRKVDVTPLGEEAVQNVNEGDDDDDDDDEDESTGVFEALDDIVAGVTKIFQDEDDDDSPIVNDKLQKQGESDVDDDEDDDDEDDDDEDEDDEEEDEEEEEQKEENEQAEQEEDSDEDEDEDDDDDDLDDDDDDDARKARSLDRGRRRRRKKKFLMRLMMLSMVLKSKLSTLFMVLGTVLQLKFFAIAVINFLVGLVRLYMEFTRRKEPAQKIIYYENAHHEHVYDPPHYGPEPEKDNGWLGGWLSKMDTNAARAHELAYSGWIPSNFSETTTELSNLLAKTTLS